MKTAITHNRSVTIALLDFLFKILVVPNPGEVGIIDDHRFVALALSKQIAQDPYGPCFLIGHGNNGGPRTQSFKRFFKIGFRKVLFVHTEDELV